jgi:hypothetical protein
MPRSSENHARWQGDANPACDSAVVADRVAVADGVVYVQEYDFPEAGPQQYVQRPRVRRIGRDGKVTTLATVGEK